MDVETQNRAVLKCLKELCILACSEYQQHATAFFVEYYINVFLKLQF